MKVNEENLDIDSVLRERELFQERSVVTMARRIHLFPSRTQKLSFLAPIVVGGKLPARIGRCHAIFNGGLAQLGERLPYKQRVTGSSPVSSISLRPLSLRAFF